MHAESILTYGLPVNYRAMLVKVRHLEDPSVGSSARAHAGGDRGRLGARGFCSTTRRTSAAFAMCCRSCTHTLAAPTALGRTKPSHRPPCPGRTPSTTRTSATRSTWSSSSKHPVQQPRSTATRPDWTRDSPNPISSSLDLFFSLLIAVRNTSGAIVLLTAPC